MTRQAEIELSPVWRELSGQTPHQIEERWPRIGGEPEWQDAAPTRVHPGRRPPPEVTAETERLPTYRPPRSEPSVLGFGLLGVVLMVGGATLWLVAAQHRVPPPVVTAAPPRAVVPEEEPTVPATVEPATAATPPAVALPAVALPAITPTAITPTASPVALVAADQPEAAWQEEGAQPTSVTASDAATMRLEAIEISVRSEPRRAHRSARRARAERRAEERPTRRRARARRARAPVAAAEPEPTTTFVRRPRTRR